MTPALLRAKVIAGRVAWVKEMLIALKGLPLQSLDDFQMDPRNIAAAESYLRRALEGFFDLSRHILAKGFGRAVSEYKEVAQTLVLEKIVDEEQGKRIKRMAGYRNRMVHYYQEISNQELYDVLTRELTDFENLLSLILKWVADHPDRVDQAL